MRLIDAAEVEREYQKFKLRTGLLNKYGDFYDGMFLGMEAVLDLVKHQPTANEDSGSRAHWEKHINYMGEESGYYWCSSCKKLAVKKFDFCPNCGARMENGKCD